MPARVEIEKTKTDVAEAPTIFLDVSDGDEWVLSVRYYFTSDMDYAIKAFQDPDGFFAEMVPFHAWKNVRDDIIRLIEDETKYTDAELTFRFKVNNKSLRHLVEEAIGLLKIKHPDLLI